MSKIENPIIDLEKDHLKTGSDHNALKFIFR